MLLMDLKGNNKQSRSLFFANLNLKLLQGVKKFMNEDFLNELLIIKHSFENLYFLSH